MNVGDLVKMNRACSSAWDSYAAPGQRAQSRIREDLGIIQKIVQESWSHTPLRNVYHIRWPDGGISNQYDNEIVLLSRVSENR